jgi:hypothetical protein
MWEMLLVAVIWLFWDWLIAPFLPFIAPTSAEQARWVNSDFHILYFVVVIWIFNSRKRRA